MAENKTTALAVAPAPRALLAVADSTGLSLEYLLDTIRKQCFKGAATDEQVDAFISIACEMKINPLLPGMLYAYPISGGGIVPIMGPAGVYKKLAEHAEVDSWETTVYPEDVTLAPTHAVCKIHRKNRDKPLTYTALLSEWKMPSNPNWNSRPRHMLALRALKHCAAQIIHGIPGDEDDRVIAFGAIDVTPPGAAAAPAAAEGEAAATTPATERKKAPKREAKGAATVSENPPETAAPKAATPAKGVEVQGEIVEDAKPAAAAEPAKVEKPAEAPKGVVAQRAFLQDKEEVVMNCLVRGVNPLNIKREGVVHASLQLDLAGDFFGTAYHVGGAGNPIWKPDARVVVKLVGRANAQNKVQAFVQSVELAAEEETAMEV